MERNSKVEPSKYKLLSTRATGRVTVAVEAAAVVVEDAEVVVSAAAEGAVTGMIIIVAVAMIAAMEVDAEEIGGVRIRNAETQTSLGEINVICAKV